MKRAAEHGEVLGSAPEKCRCAGLMG